MDQLATLPGIGRRTATRLALDLLRREPEAVRRFAMAIHELREKVRYCDECCTISDSPICGICSAPMRDRSLICVVEESKDVVAIERTREFTGRYHVLGGAISPMDGIGPEQLRIRELMGRLASGEVTEVILAMDPNVEGDATAAYLSRFLKDMDIKVTRLASGLPVGGDLEYADEVTLGRAFAGRRVAGQ